VPSSVTSIAVNVDEIDILTGPGLASKPAQPQPAMPNFREMGGPGRSHSASFDHLRRPEAFRTAMATAFFCPTNTTSRLPRVTPV